MSSDRIDAIFTSKSDIIRRTVWEKLSSGKKAVSSTASLESLLKSSVVEKLSNIDSRLNMIKGMHFVFSIDLFNTLKLIFPNAQLFQDDTGPKMIIARSEQLLGYL
jgi:hypothetical protein